MTIYGSDLLNEKNLWQIYKECLFKLPPSGFNMLLTALVSLVLIIDCAYFPNEYIGRVSLMRELCDAGLGFGSTILGFLIAGFTIFSTLAKPDMLKRMYLVQHASGLSYLKVNFFAFVEVFAVYTFLLIVYLLTKIIGADNGLAESLARVSGVNPLFGYSVNVAWVVNAWFVFLGTASTYSFLALKSFIFNTYHAVATSVVWSFNPSQDEKA